jgi:hypothetical protein
MSGPYELLNALAAAAAGEEAAPGTAERSRDPWEASMQATCECLSWRGALDNLDRRRAEDALGETLYGSVPVHARSAVVTAHSLLERGAFSAKELAARMESVRARLHRQ